MVNVQKNTFDLFVASQAEIIKSLTKRITDLETRCDKLLTENANLTKKVDELDKKERTDASSPSNKLFSDFFKRKKTESNVTETFIKKEDSNLPVFDSRTKDILLLDSYETFSLLNVTNELKLLDSFKSMGPDYISPAVLKHTAESIAVPLSLIFIKSYSTGKVPIKWTEANVTPLFKKGSKLKASNYRPVSLTSIPCKIMEKR